METNAVHCRRITVTGPFAFIAYRLQINFHPKPFTFAKKKIPITICFDKRQPKYELPQWLKRHFDGECLIGSNINVVTHE